MDRSLYVEIDSLPVMPRIGEEIDIPFFRAYFGMTWFHISNIKHVLEDECQKIYLYLKPGQYNLYWHYRKDKAQEEGELSMRDIWDLEDWQLKKKLRIGRHW